MRTHRFGGYELKSLLGIGGMARVYRASRTGPHGFHKDVALKVLDPTATATQDQIAALTDEARLGGLLRHRNIVATDELGQVGSYYYIAMELVEGWPLDMLIHELRARKESIPRSVVLEILVALCDGLAYAHELAGPDGRPLRIVHRDMKPGNVMIGRNSDVKIMDFGIAKATTNLYMTQAQATRGTPLFMSPEQVMGDELDSRSDLFSMGSILHEMVALQPTFEGEELLPVLRAVLDVDIEAATERLGTTWPEIVPVFLRCMKADRAERYASARELRRDLLAVRERTIPTHELGEWLREIDAWLRPPETGDLGEVLPGGIEPGEARLRELDGDLDTVSLPAIQGPKDEDFEEPFSFDFEVHLDDEAPLGSSFAMPLGPDAGPARGAPTLSGAAAPHLQSPRELLQPELPPNHPLFRHGGHRSSAVQPVQVPTRPVHRSVPSARAPRPSTPGAPAPPPPGPTPTTFQLQSEVDAEFGPAHRSVPSARAPLVSRVAVQQRRPPPDRPTSWQTKARRRFQVTRAISTAVVALGLLFAFTFVPGPWGDMARGLWEGLVGAVRSATGL